jgi:hypothetical protein
MEGSIQFLPVSTPGLPLTPNASTLYSGMPGDFVSQPVSYLLDGCTAMIQPF